MYWDLIQLILFLVSTVLLWRELFTCHILEEGTYFLIVICVVLLCIVILMPLVLFSAFCCGTVNVCIFVFISACYCIQHCRMTWYGWNGLIINKLGKYYVRIWCVVIFNAQLLALLIIVHYASHYCVWYLLMNKTANFSLLSFCMC